jgi:UDP-glucose:(glucosyl)LPS alpha-1,2-glucosyltransferase
MVDIVNSEVVRYDVTVNARGGTELQAELMLKHIKPEVLEPFQIIQSRVRELHENKKKVLVLQDLAQDPEVKNITDPEWRKQFSKIVFVSDWQLQQYNMICGVPYRETAVLKNAIEPIVDERPEYDGTVHIIYHTTPHRGLQILVPVFEHLCSHFDNIHLHVYSSFSIYGWNERDEQFKDLFDRCRNHPKITYYGAVSNEEIRRALVKTHIFAYPSIWPETSCISAIEALSSGNLIVCPNYAALPETTGSFAWMYGWSEDMNEHANRFAAALYNAIKTIHANNGKFNTQQLQIAWADTNYNWTTRAYQWELLLKSL